MVRRAEVHRQVFGLMAVVQIDVEDESALPGHHSNDASLSSDIGRWRGGKL